MHRSPLPALLAALIAVAVLAPAHAITFGESDAGRHPNVGTLAADFTGDGTLYSFCTGTLIDSDVVLTAAHCLEFLDDLGIETIYVSFDQEFDQGSQVYASASFAYDPEFGQNNANLHDIGVVVLADEPAGITPAQLPTANLLDELKAAGELKDASFVTVGYGVVRYDKRRGPAALADNSERNMAEQTFNALNKYWLRLSMNPSTGDGGTCYGDSGGPHFLGDSDIIVSITVTGDVNCRSTDVTYRTDTDTARAFLADYVDLP